MKFRALCKTKEILSNRATNGFSSTSQELLKLRGVTVIGTLQFSSIYNFSVFTLQILRLSVYTHYILQGFRYMIHRKPFGSFCDEPSSMTEKFQRSQRHKLNTL
jgi:hypothetical protein